ncbi:MAG: M28 family peptidase [Fulvivirga sp.]
MQFKYRLIYISIAGLTLLSACDSNKKKAEEVSEEPEKVVNVPNFNADSAYAYVKKQVAFGPRVPGTEAHAQAASYFIDQFESFGAKVQVQEFEVTTFDNQTVTLKNIIASLNPTASKRILLAAHWDSRPFADKDDKDQYKAIEGANDGASGIGVLLEMARSMTANNMPDVGVDFILFDGEDWGNDTAFHGDVPLRDGWSSWWCLGSQYWSKNKHEPGYSAYYGILLDMVGAKGSEFHKEGGSLRYAPGIVDKVWSRASSLGYAQYFKNSKQAEILDDHIFINEFAKIPTVDIVHYDPSHGYFGDYHHTHRDNIELISKETLEAVGETVMHVLYYE